MIPAGYYTLNLFGPGECINLPLFQLAGPRREPPGRHARRRGRAQHAVRDLPAQHDLHLAHRPHRERSSTRFRTSSRRGRHADLDVHLYARSRRAPAADLRGHRRRRPPPRARDDRRRGERGRTADARLQGQEREPPEARQVQGRRHRQELEQRLPAPEQQEAHDERHRHGFVGKHSVKVSLSAGKWLVLPKLGKASYSIVVS